MTTRLFTGGECPQGVLDVIEGSIGYLALSTGFTAIEYAALRILSNLFMSFTEDLGVSALGYAEATGRTTVLLSDIVLALIDLGFDVRKLEDLSRRRQYRGFKEPVAVGNPTGRVTCSAVIGPNGATIIPRPLSLRPDWPASNRPLGTSSAPGAGLSSSDQSVMPPAPSNVHLPPLPEPHTFMRTRVRRPPNSTDPASLRRQASEQRRKVQQSLIHFLARIQPVQHLFPGDPESFVLITPKKSPRPYLTALLAESDFATPAEPDEQTQPGGFPKSKSFSSAFLPSSSKPVSTTPSTNPYLLKPKFPDY